MNAYQKIQDGMKSREREVLKHIKMLNKKGEGFRPMILSMRWHHAMDRLKEKGMVKYHRSRKLSTYSASGYWVVK